MTLRFHFPALAVFSLILVLGPGRLSPEARAHGTVTFKSVLNGRDSGPGSLRSALAFANDSKAVQIVFQISTNDASYDKKTGVFTIELESPLPPLESARTMLDGLAQTRAYDSNKDGPEIRITGRKLPAGTPGLVFKAPGCEVKGLSLSDFPGHAVVLTGELAVECRVQNCVLENNRGAGIVISYGATSNFIGLAPVLTKPGPFMGYYDDKKAGNIIRGNGAEGVRIVGEDTQGNSVRGNFIFGNKGPAIRLASAPSSDTQNVEGARPPNGGLRGPAITGHRQERGSGQDLWSLLELSLQGKPNQSLLLDIYSMAKTPAQNSAGPGSHHSSEVKIGPDGQLTTTVRIQGYPAGGLYATVTGLDGSTSDSGTLLMLPWLY